MRRQPPMKPAAYDAIASVGAYGRVNLDEVNEAAFRSAQEQLIPCENCGRTFMPDRLEIHQRSCTADNPARAPVGKTRPKADIERERTFDAPLGRSKDSMIGFSDATSMPKSGRRKFTTENTKVPQRRGTFKTEDPQIFKENYTESFAYDNYHMGEGKSVKGSGRKTGLRGASRNSQLPDYNALDQQEQSSSDLVPCPNCGRCFAQNRIQKHHTVCVKNQSKKRRVFQSSKQRVQGTEAAKVFKPGMHRKEPPKQKSNWRQQHEEFIRSIRAAKQVQNYMDSGGKASDLPPPPPSLNPDYVYCEYCTRRFNPTVAERHIPKCRMTLNRPAPPKQRALDVYQPNNSPMVPKVRKSSQRPAKFSMTEPQRGYSKSPTMSMGNGQSRYSYQASRETSRSVDNKSAKFKKPSSSFQREFQSQDLRNIPSPRFDRYNDEFIGGQKSGKKAALLHTFPSNNNSNNRNKGGMEKNYKISPHVGQYSYHSQRDTSYGKFR